jgi:hypothetical protein
MPFYHGSYERLDVGTILTPRGAAYEADWKDTDFYAILETHRPPEMLAHKDAVFLCDNEDDVDNAGGATDWLFTVEPLTDRLEKHDLNWCSEISGLVGPNQDDVAIAHAAQNYWAGVPHTNESVWEYLTPSARIIAVEEY